MKLDKKTVSDQDVRVAWEEFEKTGEIKSIAERIGLKVGYFRIRAKKLGLYTPQKQRTDYIIDDCNRWAKANDPQGLGYCIEKEYLGQNEIHRWKCSNPDHDAFPAIAKSVMNGSWCRKCYDDRRSEALQKYTIEDCQKTAALHRGKCLSQVYSTEKLKWQCEYGHTFEHTYNVVLNNERWCPFCDRNKNEEFTRFIFETMFATDFKKTNLIRLNLSDRKLELDGYSPELNMAFEYNGIYHTEDETHTLFRPETLANDAEKAKICAENGIKLIIVPEYPYLKPDRWKLVENALREAGIKIPSYKLPEHLPPSFRHAYHHRIKDLIESRGGTLETPVVFSATDKIKFRCEEGHIVTSITPQKLLQGQWCTHSFISRKLSEDDIQARAKNVMSRFLGCFRKANGNTIWRMECEEGHRYERKMSHIRDGYGCSDPEHKGQSRFEPYLRRHDKYAVND